MTLGGIRIPRVPPARMTPSAISLSYLRLSIWGKAIIPIVTSVAPTTPAMAAIIVQAAIVAVATPPFSQPSQW